MSAVTIQPRTAQMLVLRYQAEPSALLRFEIIKVFSFLDPDQITGFRSQRDAVIAVSLKDADSDVVQFAALGGAER